MGTLWAFHLCFFAYLYAYAYLYNAYSNAVDIDVITTADICGQLSLLVPYWQHSNSSIGIHFS